MIKLKYNNYNKMPLNVYFKLLDIINDEDFDDMEKELQIIALLSDMSYDDLLNLNVGDINGLSKHLEFLHNFNVNCNRKITQVTINNTKYDVCTDLKKFSVAQYVDFQTYTKLDKNNRNIANILSTFVIPKGKKYGEDYDVAEVINDFNECLDLETAISLQNFFTKKLVTYTTNIIRYLRIQIMMMKKNKTNKKELEEVTKQMKVLQQMFGSVLLT